MRFKSKLYKPSIKKTNANNTIIPKNVATKSSK